MVERSAPFLYNPEAFSGFTSDLPSAMDTVNHLPGRLSPNSELNIFKPRIGAGWRHRHEEEPLRSCCLNNTHIAPEEEIPLPM
jgi:hypothetical protein